LIQAPPRHEGERRPDEEQAGDRQEVLMVGHLAIEPQDATFETKDSPIGDTRISPRLARKGDDTSHPGDITFWS
jgi:hypothetical protein